MNNLSQTPERTAAPSGWIKRRLLPALSLAAVIAIAVTVYLTFGLHPERLASFQQWVYGGAFLISLIGNASVVLPMAVMVILAGIGSTVLPAYGLAGPILVGLAGGAGAGLGEITGYLAGYGGRGVIEKVGVYDRVAAWMRRRGGITIFVMSVIPLVFDVVGIAAGSLRYPFWKFLLCCWLGRTLSYVVVVTLAALGFNLVLRWFS